MKNNQNKFKNMDKRIKWGIVTLIGVGLIGLGVRSFTPRENEESLPFHYNTSPGNHKQ